MRLASIPALILLAATAATAAAAADQTAPVAACCTAAPAIATAAATAHPWYIGPKGGDTRKGHDTVAYLAAPSDQQPVANVVRPWYIGPKGGDIRKGYTPTPAASTVVATDVHCSRYVAPARGPKGGLLLRKGQSEQEVLQAAEQACQTLCSR